MLKKCSFLKRKKKVFDSEAFNITTRILSMNVEYYTLWNFRRKILLHEFESLYVIIKFQNLNILRIIKSVICLLMFKLKLIIVCC